MKTCVPYKRSTAFALAAALSVSLHAQTQTTELKPVVVTATRSAQSLSDIVADVSIMDRADIEGSGAVGISDLLTRLPGVEMARNGGPGAATSIFLRGAESRHTAVYIDGARVDSQALSGGAGWESIPLTQIERIEVLRGPASAIYGSDAIGGVIQIFTRKGEGAFTPNASIGAGTYRSGRVQAGFSGAQQSVDYSLNVAREISQGFNARTISTQNPDDDGYEKNSASARLGWAINPAHRLEVTALSDDTLSRYDSGLGNNDLNKHSLQTGGLNWQARWNDSYSTRLGVTNSNGRDETTPSASLTQTRLRGYLWQNEVRLGPQLITIAVERREDELQNTSTTPRTNSRSQNGLALGYGWSGTLHTWQLHARQDDDSEFGTKNTGGIGYGYALTPQWRLTASAATAFRAPTLYQRFSKYGMASLEPEYSRNVEASVRHTEGAESWGLVVYRNRVDNLITYSRGATGCASSSGCYTNTAQAEYTGMTVSGQQKVGDVGLRASFDLQDPHDRKTGNRLTRRAQRYLNLGADTNVGSWGVGGDLRWTDERYDDDANTIVLPAYTLLSLHAQTRLSPDWSLFVTIDNVTDTDYQFANTYATAGRTFFVTLKWEPSAHGNP